MFQLGDALNDKILQTFETPGWTGGCIGGGEKLTLFSEGVAAMQTIVCR